MELKMNSTQRSPRGTTQKTSRIAGMWYLLVAIFGAFNGMFVDPKIYVSGNAAAMS